jgi:hypothetical protein
MEEHSDHFTLSVIGYKGKGDIDHPFIEASYTKDFVTLKQAFDELQKIDNRSFHKQLAAAAGLDLYVERAAIITKEASIVLTKRNIDEHGASKLKAGVYLEYNTKRMSAEDFEQVTGYKMPAVVLKGSVLDYVLVEPLNSLKKTKPKDISKRTSRNGDDDETTEFKGLTP